jgi:DNA primase
MGFAPARPANLAANLQKRGLLDAAIKAGLIRRDNSGAIADMFRARLMFPIRDPQGRVIAFGGRVLDQRLPKYMNSPESPIYSKARTVYGIFEARQSIGKKDRAIIVEGYIDAIALRQGGFTETVASLGTSLTVEQLRLLSRYTRNVAACFDGDDAGRKASMRALEVFLQAGLLGRGIFIPTGFDPDTLIRERGAEAMSELIDSSELLADFFLREQASAARESIAARARAAERVVEVLRLVANPFEFDILARKAAGMLGIGEDVLRREGRKRNERGEPRTAGPRRAMPAGRPGAVSQAELGLAGIALRYPALRGEIAGQVNTWRSDNSELSGLIEEICVSEQPPNALEAEVISRLDDMQRGRLSAMFVGAMMEDVSKAQSLLSDYVRTLAEAKRRREVEGWRHAAAMGDSNAAQEVILLRRQSRKSG